MASAAEQSALILRRYRVAHMPRAPIKDPRGTWVLPSRRKHGFAYSCVGRASTHQPVNVLLAAAGKAQSEIARAQGTSVS
jgi:hypothetical protein